MTHILIALVLLRVSLPALAAPVEIIPREFRGASQPQVAIAPDARVHVVFGKGIALYHTTSNDGGQTFSTPVHIADIPKLSLGMRRGPRVIASEGRVTVTAIAGGEGSLLAWTSADQGTTWSSPMVINAVPTSAREGLHAMASDGKGLAALAWLDLRGGTMELWGATSRDGGETWGANTRIYASPDGHICECCHPSVAIGPRGEIAVMWRNWLSGARDMYQTVSTNGGETFEPARKLGTGTWKLNACPMDGGHIAWDAAGKTTATWRRETAIFTTDVNGSERKIGNGGRQPVLIETREGTAVLWENEGLLMLARGTAEPVVLAEKAAFVTAASMPDKGTVIVWETKINGNQTLLAERVE